MKWFRLYDEILDDPKVQRMPAELFRFWINILSVASRSEPRGILPGMPDLEFRLRLPEATIRNGLDRLLSLELLDYDEWGNLTPHNWEARQFESDNGSTTRVRRFRERRRIPAESGDSSSDSEGDQGDSEGGCNVSRNVTGNVTCNADETPQRQRQNQRQNPEAEADSKSRHATRESADNSPPPLASQHASPPQSVLLTDLQITDLTRVGPPGGPNWSREEIAWGCAILDERPKRPNNPAGLLVAFVLAEVRGGRRPSPPAPAKPRPRAKRDGPASIVVPVDPAFEERLRVFADGLSESDRTELNLCIRAALSQPIRDRLDDCERDGKALSLLVQGTWDAKRRDVLKSWMEGAKR